jgi:hypothetical protein
MDFGYMKESDLAYCGLSCNKCPVFIATANDDNALRLRTAREWSQHYSEILESVGIGKLKPEDINCEGCRSEGTHFFGCKNCSIRPCCQKKNLVACAGCPEYESCDMLKSFFSFEAHYPAKKNLDKIRSGTELFS